MTITDLQKQIAQFLRAKSGEEKFTVFMYRDNAGDNPVPIAGAKKTFFSTVGTHTQSFDLPEQPVEFLTYCNEDWAPNALASSVYWLKERSCDAWPLVCEDVIADNTKKPTDYRHMAFIPAPWVMETDMTENSQPIKWLMGVPLTDDELQFSMAEVARRISKTYPEWLINTK